MLGLVVLLIALLLHFTGYRRYSLLLFVFMALRYMKIVPMAVMAVNGIDLADNSNCKSTYPNACFYRRF